MRVEPGLLTVLDGIYAALRREHPELPLALVTVEEPHPAVTRRIACWRPGPFVTAQGSFEGRIAFGYPSPHRNVPHTLFTAPSADVFEVLVHEAAHALAWARKVKDTSRGGTWHNLRYKAQAEELGLSVGLDDRNGWCITVAPAYLLGRFWRQIAALDAVRPGRKEGDHG